MENTFTMYQVRFGDDGGYSVPATTPREAVRMALATHDKHGAGLFPAHPTSKDGVFEVRIEVRSLRPSDRDEYRMWREANL